VSQTANIRLTEALGHAAMLALGMADTGTYLGPDLGDVDVPDVRLFFDELSLDVMGQSSTGVATRRQIRLLREDVETPKAGAIVTIDGVEWKLSEKIEDDVAKSVWVVRRV